MNILYGQIVPPTIFKTLLMLAIQV